MRIIGLTGGIACGKSTVTNILLNNNIKVIDADKIAHRALEPFTSVWYKIIGRFGNDLDMQDRIIDRKKLGNIIFNNEEARNDLNDIMHPYIKKEIETLIEFVGNCNEKVVVLDIPLLIETGWQEYCDEVWVVNVSEEKQLQRLMDRNGLTEEQAKARISSQMPLSQKITYADVIIDNNGDVENTVKQVTNLCKKFL